MSHHKFAPKQQVPCVIAMVELEEQPRLCVPTNIVGCEPDEVRWDLPVRLLFEHHGEIYLPVFELDRPR